MILMCSCVKNTRNYKTNNESVTFTQEYNMDSIMQLFLNEYFNDTKLDNVDYYFLLFYRNTDSTFVKITKVHTDLGYGKIKPIGLVKFKKKYLFVINPFRIFYNNNSDIVDFYKKSCKKIRYQNTHESIEKEWVLIVENYSNNFRIVKNEDEIEKILPYPKSNRLPVNYIFNGKSFDIVGDTDKMIKQQW